MNEKYIIADNKVWNVEKENGVAGYQFGIRIPYYCGVPYSQIDMIRIKMDGTEVAQEDMRIISKEGVEFKMSELVSVNTFYWEYGEKLQVFVNKAGGLDAGTHRLDVEVGIDVIYAPKGFGSKSYAEFTI